MHLVMNGLCIYRGGKGFNNIPNKVIFGGTDLHLKDLLS
jgi:hypothetical protein